MMSPHPSSPSDAPDYSFIPPKYRFIGILLISGKVSGRFEWQKRTAFKNGLERMDGKLTRLMLILGLAGMTGGGMSAQKKTIYTSHTADASFFSSAPIEDIQARTKRAGAAMNTETGELLFVVPVKTFIFEKSLMQEHFNEQYMESDRYPEARFEGSVVNWQGLPEAKTEINVRGKLTIHGITRQVTEKAVIEPAGEGFHGTSTFHVRLADYNIRIPKILNRNIAEEVQVNVSAEFRPL